MITGDFPPDCGGIGYYVYNLSKILKKRGYKITVLTRGSFFKGITATDLDGITVWKIRYLPIYPFHVRFHGYFLNDILQKNEKKFDIIHFHSPLVPSLKTNLPIVVTEHSTQIGLISNYTNQDLASIITKIFAREFIALDYEVLRNSDIITTVSNSSKNEIETMIPEKKEIHVIGNGVDTNLFQPDPNIKRDQKTILYTGRLVGLKGISDLIISAKEVCKKFPDSKFIITGKGPNRGYLERLVAKLKLTENIFFTGYIDRKKLLTLYQSSTIYVLPSYHEGLPTSLLEAMSCGLPSIASDVAGSSEVIINNQNGILVPPKCPEELSRQIINLLDSKSERDRLAKSARDYIIHNYDWNIIVDKIEKIYHSISE
jgi:glycosyltransferase involved in cell wall biosynthesis